VGGGMGWQRFVLSFAASFVGLLFVAALLVLLMNPYGNLRLTLFRDHVIMDINQRFQYPALVRSKQFDSVIMGTSDARLLHPNSLETVFGGRFANLALNAGKAWEQYRLIDLFIREVEHPKRLIMALDHAWCDQNAAVGDTTFRGFPEWIYDDNSLNDFLYMLNSKAIETSVRQLDYHLNLKPARFVAGYEVFTPEEVKYDLAKAKQKIWKGKSPPIAAINPPHVPTRDERASWQFPAVAWLNEIFARFSGDVIVVFMPVHIKAQPVPGSSAAAKESECKQRIIEIAERYNAPVIDFRIWSDITSNDSNYWDPLHYRLAIADRIVRGIERALATRTDDPKGDWLYLTGKGAKVASP
jgi:hypothetical protein